MQIFGTVLIVIGIMSVAESLIYIFGARFYKKHPDREKSYTFEMLELVYKKKKARAVSLILGVICVALGLICLIL